MTSERAQAKRVMRQDRVLGFIVTALGFVSVWLLGLCILGPILTALSFSWPLLWSTLVLIAVTYLTFRLSTSPAWLDRTLDAEDALRASGTGEQR